MAAIQLKLDLAKPRGRIEYIDARQGDSEIAVEVTITDNAAPFDFGENYYLEMVIARPDGSWAVVTEGCEQQEGTTYGNVWDVTIPAAATSQAGLCDMCYCTVKSEADAGYRRTTQNFLLSFDESATGEASVREYSDQVDNLIAECEAIMANWQAQVEAQATAFSSAQTQRAADWQAQMDGQQDGYESAESSRDEAYASTERARNTAFAQAQEARATAFADAQGARATAFADAQGARALAFSQAETQRDDAVADAVADADAATARANTAAQNVEEALSGDLSAVFDGYLDDKKDVAGGFPAWETYQQGIANAGTPDNVTISKTAGNLLQVHPDLQAEIEMVRSALFDDITANPWVLTFDTADDAILNAGIYNITRSRYDC